MDLLKGAKDAIRPLNEEWYATAQKRLDNLTKPLGSLGRLEEFARKVVAIIENKTPLLDKTVVFTFAGDHGVTAEGVSAYPAAVSASMALIVTIAIPAMIRIVPAQRHPPTRSFKKRREASAMKI